MSNAVRPIAMATTQLISRINTNDFLLSFSLLHIGSFSKNTTKVGRFRAERMSKLLQKISYWLHGMSTMLQNIEDVARIQILFHYE